jgi:hypothetical protein
MCKGIFLKARSDEEAVEECKDFFGAGPEEIACALVCDDCFKIFMEKAYGKDNR